ncbi:unnamed protein product [Aphanomyces euteiches]
MKSGICLLQAANFLLRTDFDQPSRQKLVILPMGVKNKKQVVWTQEMDEALLKEVVRIGPYETCHGNVQAAWSKAALAMNDFDPSISGRACQARCDNLLLAFEKENKVSMRAPGVDEDEDDVVKLKQDILDRREDYRQRKIRKRGDEKSRSELLETAGEKACNDAEERVAKRLATSSKQSELTSKKEPKSDPIEQLLAFEHKRHDDEHTYRMERLEFEKNELQQRRAEQRQMAMLMEKLIDRLGN